MSKLSYKLSFYILYAMFAVIIAIVVLFFVGGNAQGAAVIPGVDPDMWQPAQTDALLYLVYVLFGLAILVTVVAAVFQFGSALKESPGKAVKSLLGLVLLVVVLGIAWSIGDGSPLVIKGYDGTDNVPFWLKLTDMFLYSIYILLFVAVVAIIASGIKKKLL